VVTVLVSVAVVVLAVIGFSYAYVRYEWGKVTKIACTTCTGPAATSQTPYNVLLIGSDTRAGDTGQAAKSFGTASEVGGQRSDTIKVLHVDPETGSARLLSLPRDTYVEMSGLPTSTGLTGAQKLNTAYNNGPVPLVQTVENTFGIPISHFIVIDFNGVIKTVDAVGGIRMRFNYAVRDDDNGNNNSGLAVSQLGCVPMNGNQVLALARSRYFQYYDPARHEWISDPTSDLGRIERQNLILEALMTKVKSTYNPLTLRAVLSQVVHDISVDKSMSLGMAYDLVERYHALSPSQLETFTLPTAGAVSHSGDVEVVQQPAAQQVITTFLGSPPQTAVTPPLTSYGSPQRIVTTTTTTAPPTTTTTTTRGKKATTTTTTAPPSVATPPYDPTPC
jgi:LCP family protein required for cell wall assembly